MRRAYELRRTGSGSANPAASSTTPKRAIPTAGSTRGPPSRTSPRTGTARSAARARLTSHPSRASLRLCDRGRVPRRRAGRAALEALVFAVGFSSLGAEIAAARLMAPFFGSSTVIWANTIAVVLLALSAGYKLGGVLADRRPSGRDLSRVVLLGALLLAVVPFIAHPFLSLSVHAFDELSVGAFFASLFGTLVLVAVPLLLLGAVSPWATRLRLASVEAGGSVAGRLYAVSTLGSLVGVFFVALWAIEAIGTQRTFIVLALVPARRRGGRARARVLVVPPCCASRSPFPRGRRSRPRAAGCSLRPRRRTSTRGSCSATTACASWSSTRARRCTRCAAGDGAHRRLLGRVPRAAIRDGHGAPRRMAALERRAGRCRAPTRVLSVDLGGRGGHRPRAVQDRAALLRAGAAPDAA